MFRLQRWAGVPSTTHATTATYRFASSAPRIKQTDLLESLLFPRSLLRGPRGLVGASPSKTKGSSKMIPLNAAALLKLTKPARNELQQQESETTFQYFLQNALRHSDTHKGAAQGSLLKNVPGCTTGDNSMVDAEAEWLAKLQIGKKKGRNSKKLSKEQYAAILLYSQGAMYRGLNSALRSRDTAQVAPFLGYIKLLVGGLSLLPERKRRIYRGVSSDLLSRAPGRLNHHYQVGSTVTWWGVSSCSVKQHTAQGFTEADSTVSKQPVVTSRSPLIGQSSIHWNSGSRAPKRRSTLVTIDAQRAIDISALSFFPGEAECLIRPGTQFRVVSSSAANMSNNWTSKLHLKEVGLCL